NDCTVVPWSPAAASQSATTMFPSAVKKRTTNAVPITAVAEPVKSHVSACVPAGGFSTVAEPIAAVTPKADATLLRMTPATPPSEIEDIDQPPLEAAPHQKITASFTPLGTVMFWVPLFAAEPWVTTGPTVDT